MKLVLAAAPTVVHFLIGKLQELTNSCQNIFEKLLFSKYCIGLSVPKTTIFEIFCKKSTFSSTTKTEFASCRGSVGPSFLNWEITHDLTSSCSKIFKKLFFLKYCTGSSVPKTTILEIFAKK